MQVNYNNFKGSIAHALCHFGIWYELIDLAGARISGEMLTDTHLLFLAQKDIGESIDTAEADVILKAVNSGMGLLILDGCLQSYPRVFLKNLGIEEGKSGNTSLLMLQVENPIVSRIARNPVALNKIVQTHVLSDLTGWNTLLTDEKGLACGLYRRFGSGRVVLFLTSSSLWQDEYLGFTAGLDGVFRNSIVWAAKKPYIMKAMPPFVTVRVDDVSFSGSPVAICKETVNQARWVDVINKEGFIPNTGVFIDDIKKEDVPRIREKHHRELAEFSPHAFTDPKNINEFPIYMKHNGEEFPDDVLRENFKKVDARFMEWGIVPCKPVNIHFGEIGLNALPYLKERGERYLTNPIRVGRVYADPSAHSWDIAPYGNPKFCFGTIPEDRDFFNVSSNPGTPNDRYPDPDFMFGCTTFWKENQSVDVRQAIKRGIFQITRELENGFFGCLTTHEQRISYVTLPQWEEIIYGISLGISDIPHIFKSYGYISMYAENRTFYEIENAEYGKKLMVRMKGRNTMPQHLYLFVEENGGTVESFLDIPEFEESIVLNFPLKQ